MISVVTSYDCTSNTHEKSNDIESDISATRKGNELVIDTVLAGSRWLGEFTKTLHELATSAFDFGINMAALSSKVTSIVFQ